MQIPVRCALMRGGTSKGAYFLAEDLPSDPAARDRLLLSIFGSPDPRQVDGVGGAHPLTSKTAIVSRSTLPDCDIDFLFGQVGIAQPVVDTTPNCGNILSGVGPFAIERGLIAPTGDRTRVRVRTINTGTIAELLIETPGGRVNYGGDARIDGVPGTAAPVTIDFLDAAGSVCGSLLPTGNAVDIVDGVPCTLIDNGMPVIVMRAADVGRTGYEPRDELDKDGELKAHIERIRLAAGPLMNLGDVAKKVVPKIALLAPPQQPGGHVSTRSFIPHECHASIGVFAAVTVATACVLPGSPAASVAQIPEGRVKTLSVEHPTGEFSVRIEVGGTAEQPVVERAGLLRTARLLFDGTAYARAEAA
ncbi:4-oxalomesaconate tautomerase [Bosea sp. (in: a-proteobacteria)]|uniref:4-oxalomesaconate tautomerase n=1 Tax=Bosea sp. (in: a-proteobacteria) TaxID=1871050 RepID=UPI00262DEBCC|nr:4-oxalomesaconate tautomerase [Bosea sp. (in: a-proteobacteria)]MCO5089744.1 4-oxalomesaconate tautomerase [Bosea sp. (in: a-proteobacteria)]